MTRRRALLPFAWTLLATLPLAADPLPKERVPPPLQPWVDWALRGHESELCPFFLGAQEAPDVDPGQRDQAPGATRCAWPGRLALNVGLVGGRFRQEWTLDLPGFVPLPGEERRWPLDLTVDGRAAAAVARGGAPGLWLPAGRHVVEGRFDWDVEPESLAVPKDVGLVALTLDGAPVPFPERDADGRLFLQSGPGAESEEESLTIVVQRKVIDEIPLLLVTRIELAVSGEAREVLFGRALPAGFIPVALTAPLPVRIEADGRLRVQVRPGTWALELTARHPGPAAKIELPAPGGPWAAEEVWVFEARPSLRVAEVAGVAAVDPQQTSLPEDWKALPAYRLRPGDAMRLAERRRGDANPAPDRLTLSRVLWLDFDGGGYTWQDRLEGTLTRSWRLEMAPPGRLERVLLDGRDQVITRRAGFAGAGVEVRQGALLLGAEGRLPGGGSLPAVGWSHDFQQVSGVLHLPPGWRILGAFGADQVPGTWIASWTLLDLFLVLLLALAVRHLWGTRWALLALAVLVLTWQEEGAPRWIWVAVLALEALRRLLPASRATRVVEVASLLARAGLVVLAVAFVAAQVRQAIYPSLEGPGVAVGEYGEVRDLTRLLLTAAASKEGSLSSLGYSARNEAAARDQAAEQAEEAPAEDSVSTPSSPPPPPAPEVESKLAYVELQDVDPRAVANTGPGLPEWEWTRVELRWSGPVEKSQRLRLLLLSPLANRLLTAVRVALLGLLVLLALGLPGGPAVLATRWRRPRATAAALLALLLIPAAARAQGQAAGAPTPETLERLRAALTEKPDCFPECAASPRLFLDVSPEGLRGRFEVGAAADVAVPIPGGVETWIPAEVAVDGEPAPVVRTADGRLWVRLTAGRHEVSFAGPLPRREIVQIPLPLKPHHVEVATSGWTVAGLYRDGVADDTLQLTRVRQSASGAPGALQPGALPPFLEVERTLRLGLTWQVATRVTRRSPAGAPAAVEVPLLPGESVTTEGLRVADGVVLVSLGAQTEEVIWTSTLAIQPALALVAPKTLAWTEVWRLDASPIWHVEAKGIPAVVGPENAPVRVPEWRPWPGERLDLAISRPEGIAGRSLTLVRSVLTVKPGARATDGALELGVRSSRGGQHTVVLPEGAALSSVAIDGQSQPVRQEGRRVVLPIRPGPQRIALAWRESRGISTFYRTPAVDLGTPGVNAFTSLDVPPSRWILFAGGPRLGPAVLFWSVLVVILLVAWGLGRTRWAPLRTRDWILLGIGLSQVPLIAAAVVAAWLLVLGVRRERGAAVRQYALFGLMQVALAFWTLVALGILFWAIQKGLLGRPDMQIAGNSSSAYQLLWYADRTGAVPPTAWVLSVPLLVYRLAMLAWALWLALALLKWLRWAWESFTAGGGWRAKPPKPPAAPPPAEAAVVAPAATPSAGGEAVP